jgi:hypothetical protein
MVNWQDADFRRLIINEITGEENLSRKRFEQRKFDVYRNRQDRYVIEKLESELKPDFVQRMRKVLSINPCKRIIDEMASLYRSEPERTFEGADERAQAQIDELYESAMVDAKMRLANAYYKLHDQCAIYVAPRDGIVDIRVLSPKDYDVIPDAENPERAQSYILSTWDSDLHSSYDESNANSATHTDYYFNDKMNQNIADDSDRLARKTFIVWDRDVHFTMNGLGEVVSPIVPNPIGVLPFIDVAIEKDFQFFVRRGSGVVEFTIDLLAQLSDLASISRIQGYSQGVISSTEEPKPITVGPDRIMWLKKDPNAPPGFEPSFQFVSPSPDLAGGLEIIDSQVKMFLSSQGLDASTVSGKGEKRSFASGVDHLLANIDKFQASQQDMSLFRWVETQLFDILRAWSNVLQGVRVGPVALNDSLQGGIIPESVELSIKFEAPHAVRTQTEVEDSVIRLMESGLMSRKQAVARLYEVSEDQAEEIIEEIDGEDEEEEESEPIAPVQPTISGEEIDDEAAEGDEASD